MSLPESLKLLVGAGLLLVGGVAGVVTRDHWLPLLAPAEPEMAAEAPHDHHHGDEEAVTLSPQAVANLKLVSKPLRPQTYWKTIDVPGAVIDRPGVTDRGVAAPVAGVVTRIHAQPGDTVEAGAPLFTLKLVSEYLLTVQADLFKTTREMAINRQEYDRLAKASAAIPPARFIELDNQHQRHASSVRVWRQELQARGLSPTEIDAAADGKFVQEVTVAVPSRSKEAGPFEVHALKVERGQQVQAGQPLVTLADPRALLIEGRAFPPEAAMVERAARQRWLVAVEFAGDDPAHWREPEATAPDQEFVIRTVGSTVDPASNTFPFYLPLTNQARTSEKDGRTVRVWRYRPGQRARLRVPVEKWDNVLVLPADAVVREGGETYVFRQNGDRFERKPVRVLHQDRTHVVLRGDAGVPPGVWVAHSAAAALNRTLKAQQGGGHDHHHH